MFAKLVMIYISLVTTKSAKILMVVPTPSISHQIVFRPLIQELIKNNHELTVMTTDPVYTQGKSPYNLIEIDLHDLSYSIWNKLLNALIKDGRMDKLALLTVSYRTSSEVFKQQLKDKSVKKLIEDNEAVKFDLLIIEACITPALIFTHIFKAPVILISSYGADPGLMEIIGGVTHPFLYPTHYHQRIYNLTIWEKVMELYNHYAIQRIFKKQEYEDDVMLQSIFGNNIPSLSDLKNNYDLLFLNIHPIWVHNQPVPPNVVYTWGIHKIPEKELPEDLQHYLDKSKDGVIYISFGTNVKTSSIPKDKLDIMIKVFSRLPFNILWKWDTDELPGKSENIKICKWFPQRDILRHPNLKLFVTQGGLQSTDEAIDSGVPLIGIPMSSDQEYNTEKYVHFNIGIQLIFKSMSVENLDNAISTILNNYDSYRNNIIHLRTLMQDQAKSPLENAIWWIEYVLRHGGARQLRTPAANMSWVEYYELKLVLLLFSALVGFGTVVYFCLKLALSLKISKIKLL